MKKIIIRLLIVSTCFSLLCCNAENRKQVDRKPLNNSERFWVDFSEALRKGDTNYLINNSLDTIQCGDCPIDNANKSEFYKSDFLFANHLERFKPTEDFKEYSIFNDNGVYRVTYSIKWAQAPGGAYNVVYNFIDTPNGFRFQGMFPVP